MSDQQRENELEDEVAMRSDTARCKFDKFLYLIHMIICFGKILAYLESLLNLSLIIYSFYYFCFKMKSDI